MPWNEYREQTDLYGRASVARIGLGAFLGAADYVEAVRQRRELGLEMAAALAEVDIIVSANATGAAPRIDAVGTRGGFQRGSYTPPFNVNGVPAFSVPSGLDS